HIGLQSVAANSRCTVGGRKCSGRCRSDGRRLQQRAVTPAAGCGRATAQLVKGLIAWAKSQVFCAIPEQSFLPRRPGQLPLSRWIAHIDSVPIPFACAKATSCCASATVVTSVFFG